MVVLVKFALNFGDLCLQRQNKSNNIKNRSNAFEIFIENAYTINRISFNLKIKHQDYIIKRKKNHEKTF